MKKKHLPYLLAFTLLASCASEVQKKVLVIGKGDLAVADKNITMKSGSGYAEKEMPLTEKGVVQLAVETEAGKQDVQVPEAPGFYILNLKTDTLVGSQQIFGKDISNSKVISQEELKLKIDSLQQMIAGTNINNKTNFRILPNQVVKVSDNLSAQVFGPYHKIPAELTVGDDNKEPEIYKFYTHSGLRELIETLQKLTY